VNPVLWRDGERALLFEAPAARPDIVEQLTTALAASDVARLDAVLVTHCHGDHAGMAGVVAGLGRERGDRAPVHVHSAGYRFLTQPAASYFDETFLIFQSRAQYGMLDLSSLTGVDMLNHPRRAPYASYFTRTPRSALHFVDEGRIPGGFVALATPGHSNDCVLYLDRKHGVAIPGDTIICVGRPEDPATHDFVVPIFTVMGQGYSRGFESYLMTIRRVRKLFETHDVRVVLPPHGRFAVVEPMAWVRFAERYFEGLFRILRNEFLLAGRSEPRREPFTAADLSPLIPHAHSHTVSTPSHMFGMLCALSDEGYLTLAEDVTSRRITFALDEVPPDDYMARRLGEDPGALPLFGR
jgi:glyoxylase-like metal-dependent hydrolase (beta-lactamase superfamily II)